MEKKSFWKGFGCGIGGFDIGSGYLGSSTFVGDRRGTEAIMRIMDVVGVAKWEDLTGKYVRCKVGTGSGGIDEIGNILHNKWFNIREFYNERGKKSE